MARFGEVPGANTIVRCIHTSACTLLAVAAASAACSVPSAAATSPKPAAHSGQAASTPLSAPKTSFSQDEKFFTDVTVADPALVTYEQQQKDVALRALLTDGSAFSRCCIEQEVEAQVEQASIKRSWPRRMGSRNTESTTHLPLVGDDLQHHRGRRAVDALCFGTEAAAGPRTASKSPPRSATRWSVDSGLTSAVGVDRHHAHARQRRSRFGHREISTVVAQRHRSA